MPEWRITRLGTELALTWDEGNIRRRYRLGTSDPKEAARRAPARYAELTRPKGTTVHAIWKGYTVEKAGLVVVTTMKFTWKALEARFGQMEAEAITVDDCTAHTAERRKQGRSDGTIHTELGHLRTVLKWAEKRRLINRAPHIARPSKPEPKEGYLTREQVERLLASTTVDHIRLAVMLMIGTGARNAAALELTWDRVDFQRRLIQLRNPFDGKRKKSRATVPMNNTLLAALQTAKDRCLTPFVIEWADGPVKSIKKGLGTAAMAAGLSDVSPHVLRHSAAVWLAEDGHPMSEIAQFLGHADSRITERVYSRYSPDHLRSLAASLEVANTKRSIGSANLEKRTDGEADA